jgi:hypothetical protein
MRLREVLLEEKIEKQMALNLSELSRCSGYSRSTLTEMVREGLPLYHGKITLQDFRRWVKEQGRKACSSEPEDPSLQRVADKLYAQS